MNKELAITGQQYGLLFGIFFFGYFLFEIPSNLLLHKIGARIWIARILITWGIVATLTGFMHTVHQLYIVRSLLGLAEAGYFPGMALYLTYWFPQREQARACPFDSGQSCYQHPGGPGFGSHPGSCALARRQQLALAPDLGGNPRHSLRLPHLYSAPQPSGGSKVPRNRREGMDSSEIRTRRTTKIGAPPILSAPGFGKRWRVASGPDLFWDDDRFVCTDLLGAAAGEITLQSLFQ